MKSKSSLRPIFILSLLLAASFSRIIPHPANFAPIGALGLFGAAYFNRKWVAVLLPLVSLFLSDLVINNTLYAQNGFTLFYLGSAWVYGSVALISILGFALLKKVTPVRVIGSAVAASIIFYIVTNFGCLPGNPLYAQNFSGLVQCYLAGIPFIGGTLAGNLFYSIVLFGGFELAAKFFPLLSARNYHTSIA